MREEIKGTVLPDYGQQVGSREREWGLKIQLKISPRIRETQLPSIRHQTHGFTSRIWRIKQKLSSPSMVFESWQSRDWYSSKIQSKIGTQASFDGKIRRGRRNLLLEPRFEWVSMVIWREIERERERRSVRAEIWERTVFSAVYNTENKSLSDPFINNYNLVLNEGEKCIRASNGLRSQWNLGRLNDFTL